MQDDRKMWTHPGYLLNHTVISSVNNTPASSNNPVTLSVSFLPLGLFILILTVLGIVANTLSAIVLSRPRMKSTYSTITLGLTFCDTIFLLTKLLRYGLQSMFTYFSVAREYTHVFYPIAGPAMRALTATSHTGFTYFTMAVAADRYFVVCWPLHARRFWSIKRSIYLSAALILFSVLYNLPRWWEFDTIMMNENIENNGTNRYYKMQASDFRKNRSYRVPYKISYLFVMNFIPFFSLAFMNTQIWRTIQDSQQRKESLTSVQRKEKSFSLMLLSIVVLFLLCSSVYFVTDIMEIFGAKNPAIWDNIGNFLLTFNSAVNFVLYCMFGSRFRVEFIRFYRESLSFCYYRCILRREPAAGSRLDLSTTMAAAENKAKVGTR